jgi:ribosomal protein S27AE
MTKATAWLLGESCPDCGTALTLLDDGTASARPECGSCGYADTWTVTVPAGGGGR